MSVPPGTSRAFEIPVGRLPSGVELAVPIEVVSGIEPGPAICLSGAIHGDEIVGVEVIRTVLDSIDAGTLHGTVVAAPIVNVFGFLFESRYLPDRRDLNRSFPGSKRGSLAGRLAHMFLNEVLRPCDFGIDYHSGSDDRVNLPQTRGNLDDAETHRLAEAFGAPVMIHSKPVKGSLRAAARRLGKRVLLYEGGEPKRFNPLAVEVGAAGTLRVLAALGMLDTAPAAPELAPLVSRSTAWTRAPRGGILRLAIELGDRVSRGDAIGTITDPAARDGMTVRSRSSGIVVGLTANPLVSLGDAIAHVADVGRGSNPQPAVPGTMW